MSETRTPVEVAASHPAGAIQVAGFPNYSVTQVGVVWSIAGGAARPLALGKNRSGYITAHLFHRQHHRLFTVHRLVARAFLGEPLPGHEVRHLDGNPANNEVANLAWGTPAENAADRERHGTTVRGTRHHSARFTPDQVLEVRSRHAAGASQYSLAKEFAVSKTAIWKIVNERVWTGASLES